MEERGEESDPFKIEEIDLEEERRGKAPKPHPLETQNPVLQLLFYWVGDVIKKSSQTIWKQEMNYDLPEIDEASKTNQRLEKSLSESKSVITSLLLSYKIAFLWIIIAKVVINVLQAIAGILHSSAVTLLFKSPIYHNSENAIKCAFQLILAKLITLVSYFVSFYFEFYADRMSMRLRSGMYSVIHNKIMRFSIFNSTSIKQGLIADLIEIDVQVMSKVYHQSDKLLDGLVGILINFGIFVYLFGIWQTLLFLGVNLVTSLFKIGFSKLHAFLRRKGLEANDKRMSLLRNVLQSTDYIKINGLEDYFCLEMFDRREGMIFWMKVNKLNALFGSGLIETFVGLLPMFVYRYYWVSTNAGVLGFAMYLQFNNFSGRVSGGIHKTLGVYGYYLKMMVSLNRLNKFFKSDDKRNEYLVEIDQVEGEGAGVGKGYALKVLNGDFKWRFTEEQELKPIDEEGSVLEGNEVQSSGRRTLQILNRIEERRAEEQSVGLLTETVSTQLILGERKKEEVPKGSFRLKNINLEIKKGEKVAVIGGSNSGMSSLLYALIGEMIPTNEAKVYKSGSLSYLPQSRWLMGCSVKDNIMLGRPYDEELLKTSLEGADLLKDIDQLENGVETIISDGGDNVSGGQKARIALARCFYQW